MLAFIITMFVFGTIGAVLYATGVCRNLWIVAAIVMTSVNTMSCSRLIVVPDADGQGVTLVRRSGIEAAEQRVWDKYISGWYSVTGARPRTVAVTRSQLNEIYSGYKELYPVEGGVIGGLYFKETQTVYYLAGHYKVLKHEYCHHVHHVKGIKMTRQAEEAVCREAAL